MNRVILIFFCCLMLFGCFKHIPIDLTSGGQNVSLVSSEFPLIIPNRPLDKCSVLSQITIVTGEQPVVYGPTDFNNALRNKTADIKGNVAIRLYGNYYSVRGMALYCPDEVLKAAGFTSTGYYFIRKGKVLPTSESDIQKRDRRLLDTRTGAFL